MKRGTIPYRSCLGCGGKRPKGEFVRLVLSSEGQPVVDAKACAPGRGAYLCGSGCLMAAIKRKAFQRAFRGRGRTLEVQFLEASLRRVA